jgi:hypothetical protein
VSQEHRIPEAMKESERMQEPTKSVEEQKLAIPEKKAEEESKKV